MRTALAMALGFSLGPALIGLIALYVWACSAMDPDRDAVTVGALLCFALLVVAVAFLIWATGR